MAFATARAIKLPSCGGNLIGLAPVQIYFGFLQHQVVIDT